MIAKRLLFMGVGAPARLGLLFALAMVAAPGLAQTAEPLEAGADVVAATPQAPPPPPAQPPPPPPAQPPPAQPPREAPPPVLEWRNPKIPGLVETEWLAQNLTRADLRILDCRPALEYTQAHIPGSISINFENLRGTIGGVPGMLLPRELLAQQFSLLGLMPTQTVVIVPGEELRDATLIALALERVGHAKFAILNGGYGRWLAERRSTTTTLPRVAASRYPAPVGSDGFTVDSLAVVRASAAGDPLILDVRAEEYYSGGKSEEARAGRIPKAKNRFVGKDIVEPYGFPELRPRSELEREYRALLPDRTARVIVHCRTGREASQTYFVLRHLLDYPNVQWYDGGWTEWAARPDLPVEK